VPEVQYLTIKQVAKMLGVHPKTLQDWRKQGLFPEPQNFGLRTLRYRKDTIEEWLASRDPLKPKD